MGKRQNVAKNRVRVLDLLRGFSVLSMVLYHGMFDLVYLFSVPVSWYGETPGYVWQQSICWTFILVSGASLHYGQKTVKRGGLVLLCAVLVSAVSFVAMPSQRVLFGILHFLGVAMLLFVPLRGVLQKINPRVGGVVCFGLFLLTKTVPRGYLGIGDMTLWPLPQALYQTDVLFVLGLPGPGFFSADYFPLVPWLFLFFTGYFLWGALKGRFSASKPGKNPLEWAGRHSLGIYVVHQPLLYGLCLMLQAMGVLN